MSMADILTALIFVAGTAAVTLGIFALTRLAAIRRVGPDTRDLAGSVIFRVGALHSLILALVFAQELLQYQELRVGLVREATAVADVYYDAIRYAPEAEVEQTIRSAMRRYADAVVHEEWQTLHSGKDGKTGPAWQAWEDTYQAVLNLTPANPREEALRANMLAGIHQIADERTERENLAVHALTSMFWTAALLGVALVVVPYFIYAPTTVNVVLLSVFGGYTGLILLFIHALANPFESPGQLQPLPIEQFLTHLPESDAQG